MDEMVELKKALGTCIQCGTCTGSCPNADEMDLVPRKLWRMVLMDRTDSILDSRTFTLCSSCYMCTLRCPRGLPLTDAMAALKAVALKRDIKKHRQSTRFYASFMESVRRHGRVREGEFMGLYFLSMKNPLLPLRFVSLGLKLMGKNKVAIELPAKAGHGNLTVLFKAVAEIEEEEA
ncbi:MAG: 4Fe-4S dicluster domain-containing protein [Desulfobacterium sp.]|nr:4Fe-4S dicluster domain-containing protein [Desulfobacterium sp.]